MAPQILYVFVPVHIYRQAEQPRSRHLEGPVNEPADVGVVRGLRRGHDDSHSHIGLDAALPHTGM